MTLPDTMRAVVLTGHGDLDKLVLHNDWPCPRPAEGQVLVQVHACGLNNTDVNTRTAWYSKGVSEETTGASFDGAQDDDATWGGVPVRFPRIQGADVAGTVAAVGHGVDRALVGRRVMIDPWLRDWNDPSNLNACGYFGSECDGGYAEFTVVDARHVHPLESGLTNVEIASFATSYVTAENMLNRAAVREGDTVLIPGASGGVGSALIQLAERRGARTVAMASEGKHASVADVGPDAILSRSPDDLRAALKAAIGEDTVTVVVDVVVGRYWPTLIDALSRGGRYVCSGAIAGPIVELDLRTFYLRDLTFFGATVPAPNVFGDLVSYVERGELKPLVAKVFDLEDLREAQQAFIDKAHTGNIVVSVDGS